MQLSTLSEWLSWIGSIHNQVIDLGLERVKKVAEDLEVLNPLVPVITVAGTNGKGSTVAAIEAIFLAMGLKTGVFTSPIMYQHNEQVRINGINAKDHDFIHAFEQIENARADISLTPFEYHTLAALSIFKNADLDILILEVGLGGRLDAVNIIDADVSIITNIDIDHTEYLGCDREAIGFEKAGIMRANKVTIYGNTNPPNSLIAHANSIKTQLLLLNEDFFYQEQETGWAWHDQENHFSDLPYNTLLTQNMAVAIAGVMQFAQLWPVAADVIKKALKKISLAGRIEMIPGDVATIFDVSHNPAAIKKLANYLQKNNTNGNTYAVFSMLSDKDIEKSVETIAGLVDYWFVAPLTIPRAASKEKLAHVFTNAKISTAELFTCIEEAYNAAKQKSRAGDRIVIFGSFHTVALCR